MELSPRGHEKSTTPHIGPLGILGTINGIRAERSAASEQMKWPEVIDFQVKCDYMLTILAEMSLRGPIIAEDGC